MKTKRILSLLLALIMCLGVLVSCGGVVNSGDGGGGGGNGGGGDRTEDGSWDNVDFEGQEVRLCISAHQSPECNFPAADIYTKGPDTAGSNEVAKEVLARNKAAEEALAGVSNVGDLTHFRRNNGREGLVIGNHVFY